MSWRPAHARVGRKISCGNSETPAGTSTRGSRSRGACAISQYIRAAEVAVAVNQ